MMLVAQHRETACNQALEIIRRTRERLSEVSDGEVIVDCSSVSMVNSEVLDSLVRLHRDARQRGATIVLINMTGAFVEVIARTRLDRVFHCRLDPVHSSPQPPKFL